MIMGSLIIVSYSLWVLCPLSASSHPLLAHTRFWQHIVEHALDCIPPHTGPSTPGKRKHIYTFQRGGNKNPQKRCCSHFISSMDLCWTLFPVYPCLFYTGESKTGLSTLGMAYGLTSTEKRGTCPRTTTCLWNKKKASSSLTEHCFRQVHRTTFFHQPASIHLKAQVTCWEAAHLHSFTKLVEYRKASIFFCS